MVSHGTTTTMMEQNSIHSSAGGRYGHGENNEKPELAKSEVVWMTPAIIVNH